MKIFIQKPNIYGDLYVHINEPYMDIQTIQALFKHSIGAKRFLFGPLIMCFGRNINKTNQSVL